MSERLFFRYSSKESFLHRHDPRFKFIELIIWSILSLNSDPATLAVTIIILIIFFIAGKAGLKQILKPLLFWLSMSVFIVFFSAASGEGTLNGILKTARLFTALIAGQLLISTTAPSEITEAVKHLLFFLPGKWKGSIALSITLTISFIPQVMDNASRVKDAALSRALDSRGFMFRKLISIAMPLAETTLINAETTADALISRCYTYDATPAEFKIKFSDFLIFSAAAVIPSAVFIIRKIFFQ